MSAKKRSKDKHPPASAAGAAERLARIVDAAERAAASVIDDAEKQAQRQLEEARERADRTIAERLRELADELDPPARSAAPAEQPRGGHLRPVETVELEESEGAETPAPPRSGSAGARLLATQMAVSGAGREEIEQRLRSGFEIDDASEILDAILGPEE
jgi:dsDNA-specific endonuclease/ATPase MutS2